MKISRLFHWLYAILMFLPVFVIPIFALAVRSDNNYQPIEVQYQEKELVDFNQIVRQGNFPDDSAYTRYNCNTIFANNQLTSVVTASGGYWGRGGLTFIQNHKYLFSINVDTLNSSSTRRVSVYNGSNSLDYSFLTYNLGLNQRLYTSPVNSTNGIQFYFYGTLNVTDIFSNFQIFDLTQMFGVGNEPTIQQFNTWYPNNYYDYTLSHKEMLTLGNVIYNDTDLGSQFLYNVYKSTDEYFNFSNVLGLNDIYEWFNVWFFNGAAPLGFYVFWLLLVYWFVISICWLVFDMLMFLPQLFHNWIDKARIE